VLFFSYFAISVTVAVNWNNTGWHCVISCGRWRSIALWFDCFPWKAMDYFNSLAFIVMTMMIIVVMIMMQLLLLSSGVTVSASIATAASQALVACVEPVHLLVAVFVLTNSSACWQSTHANVPRQSLEPYWISRSKVKVTRVLRCFPVCVCVMLRLPTDST